jgi:predicted nucleotidyltransferase component of viral defense system
MIEKNEIITIANAFSLSSETIEKDYVLSWLLWGIHNHEAFRNMWIFKGGTSLHKCYFETFRFSEDLDFTLKDPSHLTEDFLKEKFYEITDKIYEETGIEFFKEQFKFKIIPKENGKFSAQGVIHYNGPLRRKKTHNQKFASIKLDLTTDELIVLQPEVRKVFHPYTDTPPNDIFATCYAFEEVVAEKIRALSQRLRPRDVYDVVHFFRNRIMIKNVPLVYSVLIKKCGYKKIEVPTFLSIQGHEKIDELASQWKNMLAHQLPTLPPLESFWDDIEPFFDWIEGNLKEEQLVSYSKIDEEPYQPGRVFGISLLNSIINKIQFATANRVCISFTYHNKARIVEPFSFRRAKNGNPLIYGYEKDADTPKSFSLHKIQDLSITNLPYREKRYPIDINASGDVVMPPIRRKH